MISCGERPFSGDEAQKRQRYLTEHERVTNAVRSRHAQILGRRGIDIIVANLQLQAGVPVTARGFENLKS